MMRGVKLFSAVLTLVLAMGLGLRADVVELFDEGEDILDKMTNQDTATAIEISEDEFFNGEISVRLESDAAVNNGQKYNPNVPGWGYSIVEDPSDEMEMRWILFAWKKDGGEGMMIQFPDGGSWGVQTNGGRYFAGVNKATWPGIQVSDEAPIEWEYHIRDLFEDFGEFNLSGMALTQFDNVGYYDSIYLAWTEEELEQLVMGIMPVEPQDKLTSTWGKVKFAE
ncbi:hypothetical protein GF312_07625 [Candidatus Poribacteria bacterium]|nr:hypothetical protein [Candidatus Poribacteria bacterium]